MLLCRLESPSYSAFFVCTNNLILINEPDSVETSYYCSSINGSLTALMGVIARSRVFVKGSVE